MLLVVFQHFAFVTFYCCDKKPEGNILRVGRFILADIASVHGHLTTLLPGPHKIRQSIWAEELGGAALLTSWQPGSRKSGSWDAMHLSKAYPL